MPLSMMKKRVLSAITGVGVVGVACAATAIAAVPTRVDVVSMSVAESETVSGTIKSVNADEKQFVLTVDNEDIEVSVDEDTVYTLDGEKSSMKEALKQGRSASVTHEDKLASRVDVYTE